MWEEIPLQGRILVVAEAYDAVISGCVYRKWLSREESLQELKRVAGTLLRPLTENALLPPAVRRLYTNQINRQSVKERLHRTRCQKL